MDPLPGGRTLREVKCIIAEQDGVTGDALEHLTKARELRSAKFAEGVQTQVRVPIRDHGNTRMR